MSVMPEAESFTLLADGAPAGVVLCHGFTGSPASMRPWGEYLHAHGFSVIGPRLPGHGTQWRDLNHVSWRDWYDELERAFDTLRGEVDDRPVFAAGLSMGGALVTLLAERRPHQVAGLLLVNPALTSARRGFRLVPLGALVRATAPGIGGDIKKPNTGEGGYERVPLRAANTMRKMWRLTRANLAQVTAPIVLFRSEIDHVVEPASGQALLRGVSSSEVREIMLYQSYHVATLDYDAPRIFEQSVEFIHQQLGAARARPTEEGLDDAYR